MSPNGKYQAQIRITNEEGKRVNKHLGFFDTKEEALFARKLAEIQYYPHSKTARKFKAMLMEDLENGNE